MLSVKRIEQLISSAKRIEQFMLSVLRIERFMSSFVRDKTYYVIAKGEAPKQSLNYN